jgi:hypothetical protein
MSLFLSISTTCFAELENEVVGAIEGDKENSKENNRNDALAAQLLEITQGVQEIGLQCLSLFFPSHS